MLLYNGVKMRQVTSKKAFTIVEIVIAITIIGILVTLATFAFIAVQKQARDGQRDSDTQVIAEALEKYYEENGEYPSCEALRTSPLTVLPNLDPEALVMPLSSGTNSIVCADIDSQTGDVIAFVGDGSTDCQTGASCLSWTIKYRREANGEIVVINSRRTTDIATTNGITLTGSTTGLTSVSLSWNSAANSTAYQIQRATNNDFTSGVAITNHTGTTASLTSLGYDTQYYFRIRPSSGAGAQGNWSNILPLRTDAIGTPSIASATPSGTTTTVAWGNTSYATSYQMQCSLNDSTWTTCDQTTTSTSDTVSGQDQGRKYYYRVRGKNGPYNGPWSSSAQSVIAITSTPSASIGVRPVYQNTSAQPIRNVSNGRCLDASNVTDGAAVTSYSCHGGPNQNWTVSSNGLIIDSNSGKCLNSPSGGGTGGTVSLITCNSSSDNQKWTILDNGRIQNQGASGGCLEVPGGSINVLGQQTGTYPCSNNGAQMLWYHNTLRWVWAPSTDCQPWQTIQYQYRQRSAETGYTGGWIGATTNTTGTWAPTSVGYAYINDVQARCTTPDATGPWSGTVSASYTLPVPMPPQPTSFWVVRHSSSVISVRTSVSCSSGSIPYSTADQYTYENPYVPGPSYGYNMWWGDRTGSWDVPWGYNGTEVYSIYDRLGNHVPSGTHWRMRIIVRCINTSTGRQSPNTPTVVSGTLTTP